MKRETVLAHIAKTLGDDFKRAKLELTDTPETLFYVLNDAMQYETDAEQKRVAIREAQQLLIDHSAAMGLSAPEFAKAKAEKDEVDNGGNV
jgi:hypothetical protein